MMTTFDALKDGREYDVDICRVTGKAHSYVEFDTWVECQKCYEVLVCENCGHRSVGWYPLDT